MKRQGDLTPEAWLGDLAELTTQFLCRVEGQDTSMAGGFRAFEALLTGVRSRRARVWWIGNGGSAAVCSHLSQDYMNKLGLRTQFLGDPALLTCMANDFGYGEVYARPLSHLADPGDLLIAISSSGRSENIVRAVGQAMASGLSLVALSGFGPDNPLWNLGPDLAFYVPSNRYGLVELSHEAILHALVETIYLREREKDEDT